MLKKPPNKAMTTMFLISIERKNIPYYIITVLQRWYGRNYNTCARLRKSSKKIMLMNIKKNTT